MPAHGFGISAGSFIVAASTTNIDLKTICGTPTAAGTFTVVINAGVVVSSTSTGTAAVRCTAFPAGSVVRLTNNGAIYGAGGGGGGGGSAGTGGSGGSPGGDAISTSFDLTIDNTSGSIYGGGGGGGGGSGDSGGLGGVAGGGGGGGGQGQVGGGGAGGGSSGGGSGTAGSSSSQGAGGSGGGGGSAGGGTGGVWGTPGDPGGDSVFSGGGGGAAGFAVRKNSKTITWLGGQNSTQVRGSVA